MFCLSVCPLFSIMCVAVYSFYRAVWWMNWRSSSRGMFVSHSAWKQTVCTKLSVYSCSERLHSKAESKVCLHRERQSAVNGRNEHNGTHFWTNPRRRLSCSVVHTWSELCVKNEKKDGEKSDPAAFSALRLCRFSALSRLSSISVTQFKSWQFHVFINSV